MQTFTATLLLSLSIAVPTLAQTSTLGDIYGHQLSSDAEVRGTQDWDLLVAAANRGESQERVDKAQQRAANEMSDSAIDATIDSRIGKNDDNGCAFSASGLACERPFSTYTEIRE